MKTKEQFFSFTVKKEFDSKHRFDQCGVVMYLNSNSWLKGSIEYENEEFQHLGSVVTNHGYSDWATTAIDASVKSMWYRLSRRQDDFCIECSQDGIHFSQIKTIFVSPVMNSGMYQFQRELHENFKEFDTAGWEWYCPDRWVPHCTIALTSDDEKEAFFQASDLLLREFKKMSGEFVAIGLVKITFPVEEIFTVEMNR